MMTMEQTAKENKIKWNGDTLMYMAAEARQLQRELSHLQAKVDAIKLQAMDKLYHF
jgi:hypothetical protein